MKEVIWEGSPERELLSMLLEKIDNFYNSSDVKPKKLTELKIAFEEMYINVVQYAYPKEQFEQNRKMVQVFLQWEEMKREARIQIIDRGVPYNPLDKPDPDCTASVEQRPIGGLGIHMVKRMTDELQYSYCKGKNHVTLIKVLV